MSCTRRPRTHVLYFCPDAAACTLLCDSGAGIVVTSSVATLVGVLIHEPSRGVVITSSNVSIVDATIIGATEDGMTAVGSSRVDIDASSIGGGSGAGVAAAGIHAVCVGGGSPHVRLSRTLVQGASRGVLLRAQAAKEAHSCAPLVAVQQSVLRGCRQGVHVAHAGTNSSVSLDSTVISDCQVRSAVLQVNDCMLSPRFSPCVCVRDDVGGRAPWIRQRRCASRQATTAQLHLHTQHRGRSAGSLAGHARHSDTGGPQ